MNNLEVKVVDGKWVGELIIIDLFINFKRQLARKALRCKIGKSHNYVFKTNQYVHK